MQKKKLDPKPITFHEGDYSLLLTLPIQFAHIYLPIKHLFFL